MISWDPIIVVYCLFIELPSETARDARGLQYKSIEFNKIQNTSGEILEVSEFPIENIKHCCIIADHSI